MKDKTGKYKLVLPNDEEYLSGKLVGTTKGQTTVKDKDGNIFNVSIYDERYLSGELVGLTKGKVIVKDANNFVYLVDKKDDRYLSGELVPVTQGIKLSEEHKRKISEANKVKQKGEKNSQYGTCWITKDGLNKKIKKENLELYVQDGWEKGRKT
jgi:hypothetical protein